MPEALFVTRQCRNPHCRFRFPASAGQSVKEFCPKCGYKLEIMGGPFSNSHLIPGASQANRMSLSILLDNVRSALNVGSILRTCDGIGVSHVHLCGITATPDDPKLQKTALNAELNTNWSYHLNALDAVTSLKSQGFQTWSLEVAMQSISIHEAMKNLPAEPILLVAGNELSGVDPGILSISDKLIHLPMQGKKRSYNIAVAVGMAASLLLSPGCV
jgi:23S rRNA (guanosine2251-2'-O)-methyltransferase